MDAADEDIAQKQRLIADAQLNRTRRPTPDGKRRAPQENVEAKCQNQDHDNRTSSEAPESNTLDTEAKAEHENCRQRNG